jgi:xylulose-5-phosphate/fructose-6-phosphate phosphoketolase
MQDARQAARDYTREHGEDPPHIANWTWEGEATARLDDTGGDNAS